MTFLPVLTRELRVASRRAATYHSRLGVAAVGVSVLFSMLWQSDLVPSGSRGKMLFNRVAVMTMVYCLVAGARATADCLSEEKREGTLGLLFLNQGRLFTR